MKLEASFVRSAASARDLPGDGRAELALVGRSNVGKSSLINALVRRPLARTSAAPGKTRLANIYTVARATSKPFYLVDLPGYGYARGNRAAAAEFEAVTAALFGRAGQARRAGHAGAALSALLLVDMRHPGLTSDGRAWSWLRSTIEHVAVVGTKADKLARGERIRALRELESVFDVPVLPVSAATGEGLEELWKLIDRLINNSPSSRPPHGPPAHPPTRPLPTDRLRSRPKR